MKQTRRKKDGPLICASLICCILAVVCSFLDHFNVIQPRQDIQEVKAERLVEEAVEPSEEQTKVFRYPLTDEERVIVQAVVAAEAKGESFDGQCLVAQCILNTAEALNISPASVVLAPNQYAPPSYSDGYMVADAVSAVFDNGYTVTNEPIRYFYAPKYCYSAWHEGSLNFVLEHGGHRFFK